MTGQRSSEGEEKRYRDLLGWVRNLGNEFLEGGVVFREGLRRDSIQTVTRLVSCPNVL